MEKRAVYIVSAMRTPLGSFGGTLSSVPAPKLGAAAIKGALDKIQLNPSEVQEVFMGNVLQANVGQAPARQAARYAGIPDNVPCTTINKVCASGMKSIMLGAQSILLGDNDVVVAGGMENMSLAPYYVETNRWGAKFGNVTLIDGLQKDGLLDAYDGKIMGSCAEVCATEYKFTREEQDDYAIMSYKRSAEAWASGKFKNEVVPVEVSTKKGTILFAEDEEYKNVNFEKLRQLKPAFEKNGTITAANASTINDGAAAVVLMSKEKADKLGLKPLAIIRSYADAEQEPLWFTTTPAKAMTKAIEKAGMTIKDIDYFEINEAFSVVAMVNAKLLNIPYEKLNVNGGAVSLGHPLGASGARIIVTLINVLKQNNARYGLAGICNGGGGASAVLIENVE
ncbi:MAG: acetyl-CoA C-acyltransferase [Bacteroidetes bacterium]|nr:MAG: acetyl-CoA C-acyltransferase [Bacteroidota bacterium]